VAGILLGVAAAYLVGPAPLPVPRAVGACIGVLVLALGVALIVSARTHLVRTGQSPIPWKPSPELIVKGPYRFTRNSMYVGITLIEIGLGVALDNLWVLMTAGATAVQLTEHCRRADVAKARFD
jgi:protein-S-isoprenylcysteine O-methyltransferase Ste14